VRIANPIYDVVFKYLLEKDQALEAKDRLIADLKRRLSRP
jgi:hypothetical protein